MATDETGQRFDAAYQRWRRETADASLTAIDAHPARAEIAALGSQALPLLLKRLAEQPWLGLLTLLAELSGQDPAQGADDVRLAQRRWLRWGRARGLL